jgi:RimJ/RimL family protein N-acetyltransferase
MTEKPTAGSWLQPITLRGKHVHLIPLSPEHCVGLAAAAEDGELWKLWYTSVPKPEDMADEIGRRIALRAVGTMEPFTVVDPVSGDIAGMTTYMNVDRTNRRVEIGSTWYAQRFQRTLLNTEAKLLLLAHAFDTLDCIAVEFRTHFLNQQSRRAIERLGAKLDGVLRSHSIARNGTLRDTVVYSIIAVEWPAVRAILELKIELLSQSAAAKIRR